MTLLSWSREHARAENPTINGSSFFLLMIQRLGGVPACGQPLFRWTTVSRKARGYNWYWGHQWGLTVRQIQRRQDNFDRKCTCGGGGYTCALLSHGCIESCAPRRIHMSGNNEVQVVLEARGESTVHLIYSLIIIIWHENHDKWLIIICINNM